MDLEQTRPNKPNFPRIVLLFAGTILVIFLFSWALIRFGGKKLMHFKFTQTDTSRLVLPYASGDPQA